MFPMHGHHASTQRREDYQDQPCITVERCLCAPNLDTALLHDDDTSNRPAFATQVLSAAMHPAIPPRWPDTRWHASRPLPPPALTAPRQARHKPWPAHIFRRNRALFHYLLAYRRLWYVARISPHQPDWNLRMLHEPAWEPAAPQRLRSSRLSASRSTPAKCYRPPSQTVSGAERCDSASRILLLLHLVVDVCGVETQVPLSTSPSRVPVLCTSANLQPWLPFWSAFCCCPALYWH